MRAGPPVITQNASAVGGQPGPSGVVATELAVGAPGATGSQWEVGQDGTYFYLVEAYAVGGKVSMPVASPAVLTAPSGAVQLSITQSATNTETHYKIYRGRPSGAADLPAPWYCSTMNFSGCCEPCATARKQPMPSFSTSLRFSTCTSRPWSLPSRRASSAR